MASTKTDMMNADLESGFSLPSTVSKPPPSFDTKVPLPTTSNDLQKLSSWWISKRPVVVAILFLAALLLGMIIATMVIFSFGMPRDRAVLVQGVRHNNTRGHHHRHHLTNKTTTSHTEDIQDPDDAKPHTKNWWGWWSSSSSQWESYESSESSSLSESSWSPWGSSSSDSTYSSSDYDSDADMSSELESSASTPDDPDQPDTDNTEKWNQLQEICGRTSVSPESKIVNGDEVSDIRVWPWAGFLSQGGFFCGAELISPQWAVTATHCVEGTSANQITITLGDLDMSGGGETISIMAIKRHPDYNSNTLDNDIALLRLSTPVSADHSTIKPVCITSEQNEIGIFDTTTVSGETRHACYVVGWGATSEGGDVSDTLLQVESPIVNPTECNEAYGGGITDNMICTSTSPESRDDPSGSCQGDSGGPMMCRKLKENENDADVWELVGVTSFGTGCADKKYPDVLARVSQYYNWIKTTVINNW